MEIADILKAQSVWTWRTIRSSTLLAEVIREDALTSVNLAMIHGLAEDNGIKLHITSMQGAHLEKEFGADWYWTLGEKAQLIQAKKLEVATRRDLMKYTIDIEQLNALLVQANLMSAEQGRMVNALYVFYNSLVPDVSVEEYGCTACPAAKLLELIDQKGKLGQKSVSLTFDELSGIILPWFTLFI